MADSERGKGMIARIGAWAHDPDLDDVRTRVNVLREEADEFLFTAGGTAQKRGNIKKATNSAVDEIIRIAALHKHAEKKLTRATQNRRALLDLAHGARTNPILASGASVIGVTPGELIAARKGEVNTAVVNAFAEVVSTNDALLPEFQENHISPDEPSSE